MAILVAVATIHHNLGDRHVAAATEGKAVGEDQGACLTICKGWLNKEYWKQLDSCQCWVNCQILRIVCVLIHNHWERINSLLKNVIHIRQLN